MKAFKRCIVLIIAVTSISPPIFAAEIPQEVQNSTDVQFNQTGQNVLLTLPSNVVSINTISDVFHQRLRELERFVFNNIIRTI